MSPVFGLGDQRRLASPRLRLAAIQSDCIGGLDFHDALAPTAGGAKHVALDLGQPPVAGSGAAGDEADGSRERRGADVGA
jgi:hypothetical protein